MRAVHFGAGNIGRGFIAPMLSNSGYRVCFVGRNKQRIAALQKRGRYPVTLANENRDRYMVENVTAIELSDADNVARAVAAAEIVTTAVGLTALQDIAGAIAQGIENRISASGAPLPLHVIACENGVGSGQQLKRHVYRHLPPRLRSRADACVAFPNVMVDRIVPVQAHSDPLEILVEPFSEWVIPRSGMLGSFKEIKGVHYVDSLDAYLERKLFTVNTGHCCAAYFGYLKGHDSIQAAMADAEVASRVRGVLQETGELLMHRHGFDRAAHERYTLRILERFANPNVHDTVARVARSPLRKLAPGDRLLRPALLAHAAGLQTPGLISAIAAALAYAHPGDAEAAELQAEIGSKGIHHVIAGRLGVPQEHPLHEAIAREYLRLSGGKHQAVSYAETHADSQVETHDDTHVGAHAETHAGTYAETHAGTHTDTHVGTYADTHVGTHADTHVGTYADTHVGTHTDTHEDIQAETHTDTHAINLPINSYNKDN
ncbi:mannitol-1-phosphate 5-dehydrogenase [Paenibacillus tepidiphilus]|uniref:mannitol-1-phosphate 5-dehydrogenase n=1 Tax=Paenibacillus tepidiphilus TaxID=2608683 RepID=UPI00123BCFD2|nr:mannitol-1-phosphate 5-dehydrogenase [Paenibacillus tepidiphilus]